MFPQHSRVIQGSFPAGRPRVTPPVVRPGQPGRTVVQPAGSSYVTQLDTTRLNLGGAGGNALPEPVQRKMEAFYKTDFSDVRVHVGPQASSIGALAFTLGSNIYFAPGQYNPHSMHGQQLLGHELAHVLQQRAGRVRNPQGAGVAVVQDPHLEAEADRLGRQAAAQPMMPVGGTVAQRPGLVQATPAASLPGARPVAPHVQAALTAVGQPKAVWSPPVTRPAVQPQAGGHKLIVGTYMHRGPGAASLPAEAAGHTFVAVEGPGGRREAYGFSPANPQRYDFQKDIGTLRTGVPGAVQRDDGAFVKPGVKTRTYDVSPEQARAALAKVAAYKTHPPTFSLARQDCGQFATEVLKAAKIDDFAGPGVKRPTEMYRQVQALVASGAQAVTPVRPATDLRPLAPHVQAAVSAVGQQKQATGCQSARALRTHGWDPVAAVGEMRGTKASQEGGRRREPPPHAEPVGGVSWNRFRNPQAQIGRPATIQRADTTTTTTSGSPPVATARSAEGANPVKQRIMISKTATAEQLAGTPEEELLMAIEVEKRKRSAAKDKLYAGWEQELAKWEKNILAGQFGSEDYISAKSRVNAAHERFQRELANIRSVYARAVDSIIQGADKKIRERQLILSIDQGTPEYYGELDKGTGVRTRHETGKQYIQDAEGNWIPRYALRHDKPGDIQQVASSSWNMYAPAASPSLVPANAGKYELGAKAREHFRERQLLRSDGVYTERELSHLQNRGGGGKNTTMLSLTTSKRPIRSNQGTPFTRGSSEAIMVDLAPRPRNLLGGTPAKPLAQYAHSGNKGEDSLMMEEYLKLMKANRRGEAEEWRRAAASGLRNKEVHVQAIDSRNAWVISLVPKTLLENPSRDVRVRAERERLEAYERELDKRREAQRNAQMAKIYAAVAAKVTQSRAVVAAALPTSTVPLPTVAVPQQASTGNQKEPNETPAVFWARRK